MEVASPLTEDFNFTTTSSLLSYTSAPSSPRPFGNPIDYCNYYSSAPASPSRKSASDVYKDLLFDRDNNDEGVSEPFEFSFGFSGPLASADELFEDGRIRAPQTYVCDDGSSREHRGRETLSGSSNRSRRMARSLSPMRAEDNVVSDIYTDHVDADSSMNPLSATKKWKFKDLFLFRSASEGRATERGSKDPLLKYTLLSSSSSPSSSSSSSVFLRSFLGKKKAAEEESDKEERRKNNTANGRGSGRKVSVHEMHYASGRAAVIEEMKKTTPLAYHHNSMFSCLRFNPVTGHHGLTRVPSRSSFSRN